MAFTKVLGPGIHTLSNITSHNINSSGIVTAVSFVGDGSSLTGIANTDFIVGTAITMGTGNFTGNLTVGGVLTYEDVKNVDSIGVVTARNGIDCNGDLDVDGHTNLDNVSIAGVTTFSDDVYFDGATANRDIIFDRSANTLQVKPNAKLKLGQGSYSTDLYTDGINTYLDHNQNSALFVKSNIFQVYGTGNGYDNTMLRCMNGKVELGYEISNGGAATLDNLVTTPIGVTVGTGVTIERNGQSNFSGITTFSKGVYITEPYNYYQVQTLGFPNLDMPFVLYTHGGGSTGISTALFTGGYGNRPEVVFEQRHGGNFVDSYPHSAPWKVKWTMPNDNDTTDDQVEIKPVVSTSGALAWLQIRTTDNSNGLRNTLNLSSSTTQLYVDNNIKVMLDSSALHVADYIGHLYDTDTRIGFPANNSIRLEAGGTQAISIYSSDVRIHTLLRPNTDSSTDIGTNTVRFANAYVDTYYGDGSNLTGISGVSIANQSDNRLITATGTTDALNAESGLTYNGTTLQLAAADDIRIAGGSWTGEYTGGIKIQPDASNAYFQYHGSLFFRNSGGANRFQLDSGGNGTFTGSVTATGGFSGSGANLSSVNATTLDSIDSGSFLRSDAVDSSSANITINGARVGDWTGGSTYKGLFHTSQSGSEYVIMSNDTHTYISATTGYNVYIRNGNNDSTNQLIVGSGNDALTWRGNKVFHAGNDGSGSGLDSDTVDGIHASSFLRSDVNDAVAAQRIEFRGCDTNNHDTIADSTGSKGSIEIYNYGQGNDAFMAFHAGADYALYFGLDADTNKLAVGGWSMGANKYAIYHEGNKPTESDLGFNYLSSNSDDIATHRIQFQNCATDNHDTIATSSGSQGGIEIYNSGSGNDAFMAFHSGGDFAFYFGLDADTNDLSVGGWSMGSAKYKVWHQNNDGSGSGLDSDTVDGIQASSFLRSDVNDTVNGNITFGSGSGLNLSANDIYFQARVMNNPNTSGYNDGMYIGYNNGSSGATRIYGGGTTSGGLVISGNGSNDLKFNGNRVLTVLDLPSQGTKITATGGSTSTYSNHKIHDFTSNGTFEITAGAGEVEVLIVAGGGSEGGAGSGCHAGGGGGGGGIVNRFVTLGIGKYSVVVGSGGGYRNNGGNSSAFGLVALGGGAGGPTLTGNGNNGGSGGGSSRHTNSNQGGVATQPSSDAGGLGNNGGGTGPTNTNPGGGGGAGGAGTNGNGGGVGGAGKQFTQFNNNTYFGAGGNGNTSGGSQGQTQGSNHGAANTGAGGGGSSGGGTRYSGGSGRVMIRYPV